MNNPKIAALVCFAAAAWLGYGLLTAKEAPSMALFSLHLVIIAAAVLGMIDALRTIARRRNPPRD